MDLEILTLPLIGRAASVRAESVNPQTRTIEIVWTTGATVQRQRLEGWSDVVEYDEELVVSPNAVRSGRMNDGAPFLDSHNGWSLGSVLGSVVPGSARIEGGEGTATIQLTAAADVADLVQRILEKSVRFVSVGYRVHRYEITKVEGQRELWRAVDWEPMEVSAVAMPADARAMIRSASPGIVTPCVLLRRDTNSPASRATNPKGTPMDPETLAAVAAAEATTTPPANPSGDQIKAVRTEERRRTADILTLSQRHGLPADFSGDLIARGVTLDAARGAILDRLAAQNPTTRGGVTVPAQAGGPSSTDLGFRDAVTEALMHRHAPCQHAVGPNGREFRGMTLMEMARFALERRGINTRGMSKMELSGEALMSRAGVVYHSTWDFPSILANIASKTLRQGYESPHLHGLGAAGHPAGFQTGPAHPAGRCTRSGQSAGIRRIHLRDRGRGQGSLCALRLWSDYRHHAAGRSDQDHLVGWAGRVPVLKAAGEGPVRLAFGQGRQDRPDPGAVGDAAGRH